MIREFIAVGAGGALGSIARYALAGMALGGIHLFGFPLGTLAVNAAGSLLIGLLTAMLRSETAAWLLTAGFCGGFTTFSTFSLDALRLLKAGSYGPAAAYVGSSLVLCIAFAALGMRIGGALAR